MSLLLLLACAGRIKPLDAPGVVELDSSLVNRQVPAGKPATLRACVRVSEPGWSWEPHLPQVDGLSASEPSVQVDGDVSCLSVDYRGPAGAYALDPVRLSVTSPMGEVSEVVGPPLYLDIGEPLVSVDLGQPLPQPKRFRITEAIPWWVPLIAVLGALAGGWWVRRPKPTPPPPPPTPPHVQAENDWAQVQADGSLSDHAKALALSGITRRYIAAMGVPQAESLTTAELDAALQDSARFQQWRATIQQLLGAADQVKFAGGQAGPQTFARWTEQLSALLRGTRRGL